MKIFKTIVIIVAFVAIQIDSVIAVDVQDKRTFTCEVCRTDEGWKIIPNNSKNLPNGRLLPMQ